MVRRQGLPQVQDQGLKVDVAMLQRNGFCLSAVRRWFKEHNLDFRDFLDNGIDVEVLRGLNDGLADRAIEFAEKGL